MKKAILVLMAVAALGASQIATATAAALPEGNIGDGTLPNEEGDGTDGFNAFIGADVGRGEEATATNMPEAQVGST